MIATIQTALISMLGGGIVLEVLRRLAPMHLLPRGGVRHRPQWMLWHLALAIASASAVYDTCARSPAWSTLALLAVGAGYLWLSRVTWRDGPPDHVCVGQTMTCERRHAWPWPGEPGGD